MKSKFIFTVIISISMFFSSCIVARTGPPHPRRIPKKHRVIIVGSNYELMGTNAVTAEIRNSDNELQDAE